MRVSPSVPAAQGFLPLQAGSTTFKGDARSLPCPQWRCSDKFCLLIFPSTYPECPIAPSGEISTTQELKSKRMRTCLGSLVITVSPAPFSKWNLPNQRLQKSSRSLLTSSLPLKGIEINSQITSLLPVLIKQTNKKLVGSFRKEALGQSVSVRGNFILIEFAGGPSHRKAKF